MTITQDWLVIDLDYWEWRLDLGNRLAAWAQERQVLDAFDLSSPAFLDLDARGGVLMAEKAQLDALTAWLIEQGAVIGSNPLIAMGTDQKQ